MSQQDDFKRHAGFTLTELMIVVLIIGILSTIGTLIFQSFTEKSRVKKAISEILSLQTKIKAYTVYDGLFPDSLDDIEGGNMQDPWGNPYQYTNFDNVPKGEWRKDRNLKKHKVDLTYIVNYGIYILNFGLFALIILLSEEEEKRFL